MATRIGNSTGIHQRGVWPRVERALSDPEWSRVTFVAGVAFAALGVFRAASGFSRDNVSVALIVTGAAFLGLSRYLHRNPPAISPQQPQDVPPTNSLQRLPAVPLKQNSAPLSSPLLKGCYQALSPEDRQCRRKAFFEAVFPRLTKEPKPLVGLTSYAGKPLALWQGRSEGLEPCIYVKEPIFGSLYRQITLYASGETLYEESVFTNGDPFPLRILNESSLDIEEAKRHREVCLEEGIDGQYLAWPQQRKGDGYLKTRLQPFLDAPGALMGLLLYRREHICAILREEYSAAAVEVYRQFVSMIPKLPSFFQRESGAVVAANTESGYRIGPIWSPTALSQDSLVTFELNQRGSESTFVSRKQFGGRGFGAVGGRECSVTWDARSSDQLICQISKQDDSRMSGSSSSTSRYAIRVVEGRQVRLIPLGYESQYDSELGMCILGADGKWRAVPSAGKTESPKQERSQVLEDAEWLYSTILTAQLVYGAPDSVLLFDVYCVSDGRAVVGRTRDGEEVSFDELSERARVGSQGSCSLGRPAPEVVLRIPGILNDRRVEGNKPLSLPAASLSPAQAQPDGI